MTNVLKKKGRPAWAALRFCRSSSIGHAVGVWGANKKSYAQSDLTGFHHLRHRCEAETKSIPWNVDEAKPKAKHLPKELKSKARFYS